jgi:hypothetical protein
VPTNEELVRKAVITTDALAAAGALNPEQANKFIDYVVDLTGLKNMGRIVRFKPETLDIDKIGIGRRVAMPFTEARDPGVRRGVTTSKVSLTPKEIVVPFEIGDSFKQINIEGESVENHIVKMMATQFGNDVEELYVDGDTTGHAILESDYLDGGSSTEYVQDGYLALLDGWLRLADDGNTVDFEGANISANVFSRMLNAMPIKFRKQKDRLRFLGSPDLEQLFRERISTRATSSGDQALQSQQNLTPFGVQLMPASLFQFYPPVVEHLTFTGAGTSVSLRYGPIESGSVIVTTSTLGTVPEEAYVETTDYTVDETAGTVTQVSGGNIGTTDTVKITYGAFPQMLLTHLQNLIIGIGLDIKIEKDRDIFRAVNQYVIRAKVAVEFEEDEAIVKGYNIGDSV